MAVVMTLAMVDNSDMLRFFLLTVKVKSMGDHGGHVQGRVKKVTDATQARKNNLDRAGCWSRSFVARRPACRFCKELIELHVFDQVHSHATQGCAHSLEDTETASKSLVWVAIMSRFHLAASVFSLLFETWTTNEAGSLTWMTQS